MELVFLPSFHGAALWKHYATLDDIVAQEERVELRNWSDRVFKTEGKLGEGQRHERCLGRI